MSKPSSVFLAWWWLFGPLVVAVTYLWARTWSEFAFRVAGASLQLAGILTVAEGIRRTWNKYNRPLSETFVEWFRRRLGRPKPHISASVGEAITTSEATASGESWQDVLDTSDHSARLKAVEANLRALRDGLSSCRAAIAALQSDHADALGGEGNARLRADEELSASLKEAQIDGLALSAVGAVLLAFGVVLTTFPQELSSFCS